MKKFLLLVSLLGTLVGCEPMGPSTPGAPYCDSRYENCGRPTPVMKQEISSEVNGML